MAYAFAVSGPEIRHIGDRGEKFATYTVVETDVTADDEFSVPLPTPCTLWLYEADITDAGSSGATTLDPEVGLGDAWTVDTLDEVWINGTAAAPIRETPDARVAVLAVGATLVGRSQPDQANVDEVTSRITVKVG